MLGIINSEGKVCISAESSLLIKSYYEILFNNSLHAEIKIIDVKSRIPYDDTIFEKDYELQPVPG